jgi:hypothetical protein
MDSEIKQMRQQKNHNCNASFSELLPASKPEMEITVINMTATSMNVFPASGEAINFGAANAALAVAAATATTVWCGTAGVGGPNKAVVL